MKEQDGKQSFDEQKNMSLVAWYLKYQHILYLDVHVKYILYIILYIVWYLKLRGMNININHPK